MTETLHGRSPASIWIIWSNCWLSNVAYWGMFWLMITPSIGVALSGTFIS